MLYTLISVLIIVGCILMVLVVLVQNSKGGGLASNFASSNQFMGVRKTADFLEKSTWTLAIALVVLSLLSTMFIDKGVSEGAPQKSEVQKQIDASSPVKDFQAPPPQNK